MVSLWCKVVSIIMVRGRVEAALERVCEPLSARLSCFLYLWRNDSERPERVASMIKLWKIGYSRAYFDYYYYLFSRKKNEKAKNWRHSNEGGMYSSRHLVLPF